MRLGGDWDFAIICPSRGESDISNLIGGGGGGQNRSQFHTALQTQGGGGGVKKITVPHCSPDGRVHAGRASELSQNQIQPRRQPKSSVRGQAGTAETPGGMRDLHLPGLVSSHHHL